MTVCSVFVVMFFLLKRGPLVFREAWKDKIKATGLISHFIALLTKLLKTVFTILKSPEILYYLAYGVLAVIGTVVHPFFFAFHLTEILFRYPTLKNVIKAVWEPRKSLGLTFILYLILNYIFSLFAFQFFHEDFNENCESVIMCFLNVFNFTFKANGGIGGWLDENAEVEVRGEYTWGIVLFDNLANIILLIIMVSIVAGMIIDTFGSLREKEEEKNEDLQEKCFICGLSKYFSE